MTKMWETEVLNDWDHMKTTAKVRDLWTEGIPPKVRTSVWFKAIGNKSIITNNLFSIMAERGKKLSDLLLKHQTIETQILANRGRPDEVVAKIQNLK